MALVSGGRSTLNPDAPVFIPAALRKVEDFSPEWWNLVTTSTWYNEYWQSQHQEQDFVAGNDEINGHDLAGLLPDEFDFGVTDDFALMEVQYEDFLQYSEAEGNRDNLASKGEPQSGLDRNSEKSLKLSMKENGFKNLGEPAKYQEKPAKMMSPRSSHSRIQQPRRI